MKQKKKAVEEELKTGPDIARIICVDPATVRRYAREGMPHHALGAGFVRYKLNEVLAWLAQRPRKSKKQPAAAVAAGQTKGLKL
jgi:hypothetical protein